TWRGEPIWIPAEPWGYTTCHYGRWLWVERHGWLWRPGYVWGPAWVQWGQERDYVLWVPLDPDDRPVCRAPARSGFEIAVHFSSCARRVDFCRRERPQVIILERAPVVHVTEVHVIHETRILVRDVPPEARCRGPRQVETVSVGARERLAALEARPARTEFRFPEIRRLQAPAPGTVPA